MPGRRLQAAGEGSVDGRSILLVRQGMAEHRQLGRVVHGAARTLQFEVADSAAVHARRGDRLPGGPGLRGRVLGDVAALGACVAGGRAADHRPYVVAVGARALQRLQHQHADAFAPQESGGAVVERAALLVRAEHPCLRSRGVRVAGEDEVDAAGERRLALAGAQGERGAMDGHEAAAARGVQHLRRAAQVEETRHSVGQHVGGDVGESQAPEAVGPAQPLHPLEETVRGEHADAAPGQSGRRVSRVFHRGARGLEQQPHLGIHPRGFARVHAEERRVETVDGREETAALLKGRASRRCWPYETV